jgi:hypothetical protein
MKRLCAFNITMGYGEDDCRAVDWGKAKTLLFKITKPLSFKTRNKIGSSQLNEQILVFQKK